MFRGSCHRCRTQQAFGYRHLLKFDNETPGVMTLTWTCPTCKSVNVTWTGRSVSSAGRSTPRPRPAIALRT